MTTAIVLAAGLSRRMGEVNKLLLPFGKKTILETTLDNILSSDIEVVLIVIGHEAQQVKKVLDDYLRRNIGLRRKFFIVENPDYENGITTSIQAGVKASKSITAENHNSQFSTQNNSLPSTTHNSQFTTHNYMICLSDMPLISADEYSFLKNQFEDVLKQDEKAIVQPIFKGKRGNPTIFSSFYENEILNLLDTEGCKPIVQAHKNHVYLVEMPTPSILKDIDNEEEYLLVKNEK